MEEKSFEQIWRRTTFTRGIGAGAVQKTLLLAQRREGVGRHLCICWWVLLSRGLLGISAERRSRRWERNS